MRNALSQGGFDIVDLPAGYSTDQLKALANGKKWWFSFQKQAKKMELRT